jgi:hypothetical protein
MIYKKLTYEEATKLDFFAIDMCAFCKKDLDLKKAIYLYVTSQSEKVYDNYMFEGKFCSEECFNLRLLKKVLYNG